MNQRHQSYFRGRGSAPSGKAAGSSGRDGGAARSLIYGWHAALAALRNPKRRVHRIHASQNALKRLSELAIPNLPEPTESHDIDRIAGAGAVHQGIVVICDPLPDPNLEDFADSRLLVVLDQITDPHNVGAILRSAAAFGAAAMVLTERHGPSESGVLAKAASGALEHVELVRVKNLARAMDGLGDMGFARFGLDSAHADLIEAALEMQEASQSGRIALVFGAEGTGLRRLTREKCDRLVRLETPGPIKSLNVSNAAALALYAVSRRFPA